MSKQPYLDKYPNLFKPMYVGPNKDIYKNRLFVGPRGANVCGVDSDNIMTDYFIRYNGGLATGGFGCIDLGEGKMDHLNSCAHDYHVDMTKEAQLKQCHVLADWAHAYGAKVGVEFNHNGQFALPEYCNGLQPMGAVDIVMPNGNHCRQMNEDDMEQVAESYANATYFTQRGGFDQVLLHYGHGWLMGGFLSPLFNTRTDKYGGSTENRC